MLNLLKTHFGYENFRPMQAEIIARVLDGGDALVLMPTGGGKSLCYQLPALHLDGLSLVISPLIALMKDQVDALQANGIAAAFINSSLDGGEIAGILNDAKAGAVKILYVAPERLSTPSFSKFLSDIDLKLIAIDEAHCISEWGHDFRPDYRNLKRLRAAFPKTPTLALTATATAKVREDIIRQLGLDKARTFISSFDRPNLKYIVRPKHNARTALVELLKRYRGESAIVYCFSRKGTEELAARLNREGLDALPYHAGLDAEVRKETQEKFIRDETRVVVATIAFGMGIDKPDVRLIVHYNLPKSVEGYYQETGRAGRDGLPGECVLFYSYGDKVKHDFFIERLEDPEEQARARQKLQQVVDFCESFTCRRATLLEYFDEKPARDDCGGCDVCLEPREEIDATEATQKVLSAVLRLNERFGAAHVIDVLRGSENKKGLERGHDSLSVYGIGAELSAYEWRQLIGALTARELLEKRGDEYPVLGVSVAGRHWLKERMTITLPKPRPPVKARAAAKAPRIPLGGDGDYDYALFEVLRALRKRLADERGVPPFVIFGDVSLRDMAASLPKTDDDFTNIYGVGAEKLKRFGPIFIEAIADYTASESADS